MTEKRSADPADDDALGVLDDPAPVDTTALGIVGGTAQVNVAIPTGDADDLLDDDGVVDGEVDSATLQDLEARTSAVAGAGSEKSDAEPSAEPKTEPEPNPEPKTKSKPSPKKAASKKADAAETEPTKTEPTKAESATTEPTKIASAEVASASATATSAPTKNRPAAPASAKTDDTPKTDTSDPARTETSASATVSTSPWVTSVEQAAAGSAPAPAEKATPTVKTPTSSDRTPAREVELTAKRLGDQLGQASRESADLLTADRLLDPHQVTKPEPEGAWSHFLYTISGRRINIGDGKKAKARKALSARIAAPIPGDARFVPVLSRKGGVGKTTITTLLGMALADAREDRVIAVDANPDRGTLAERIGRAHNRSVRDLVRGHDDIRGFHDISAIVARDVTRLDVLASDADPHVAEAFGGDDYRSVADITSKYYSLVLTDTGTGIVHSVMGATLELADQLVIVSGLSVDEARLASETLTWLESNGHAEQARNAIVVLNQSTPGAPLVRLNELESHFSTRTKHVVRMPYDARIAGGGPIVWANLLPETRQAARELAALLVEGLRTVPA